MTFDRAWRAYADDDTHRDAPKDLEQRIRRAIAVPSSRTRARSQRAIRRLAIAAAIGVAIVWSASVPRTDRPQPIEARAFAWNMELPLPAAVRFESAPSVLAPPVVQPRAIVHSRVFSPQGAWVQLAGDLIEPTEPLQLVRLRVPRRTLQALGVPLLEPETSGLIDVDVLVGEDGLPRDIRPVRFEPQ